jgi:hypothetical protein
MVKKLVNYFKEQMPEYVTLGSWKNPKLMYCNNSTIGEYVYVNEHKRRSKIGESLVFESPITV